MTSNKYWREENGQIFNNLTNAPFSTLQLKEIHTEVRQFFELYNETFGSMSQLYVVTKDDYEDLPLGIPVLKKQFAIQLENLVLIVPPQINTKDSTRVSDYVFRRYFSERGIVPFFRIISNKNDEIESFEKDPNLFDDTGTFDIIYGTIDSEAPQITYFMNPDNAFVTKGFGASVTKTKLK